MRRAPRKKSSELFGRLGEMSSKETLNQLELARIRKEAKNLISVDAADAYMTLGIAACLLNDVEQTKRNHFASLRLENSAEKNRAFATSLEKLGLVEEALSYAESAFKLAPDNLDMLREYSSSAGMNGQLDKIQELAKEWGKRADTPPPREAGWAKTAIEMGFSGEELSTVFQHVYRFVRDEHLWIHGREDLVYTIPDGNFMIRRILVRRSDKDIADLNYQLAGYLAENVEYLYSDQLTVLIDEYREVKH